MFMVKFIDRWITVTAERINRPIREEAYREGIRIGLRQSLDQGLTQNLDPATKARWEEDLERDIPAIVDWELRKYDAEVAGEPFDEPPPYYYDQADPDPEHQANHPMTVTQYQRASENYLAQARQQMIAGDLAQASESGWGATVQILKAIAEQRGWDHNRHRDHLIAVSCLRSETGDHNIRCLFSTARALNENFYENMMDASEIYDSLEEVEALVGTIQRLLKQG